MWFALLRICASLQPKPRHLPIYFTDPENTVAYIYIYIYIYIFDNCTTKKQKKKKFDGAFKMFVLITEWKFQETPEVDILFDNYL